MIKASDIPLWILGASLKYFFYILGLISIGVLFLVFNKVDGQLLGLFIAVPFAWLAFYSVLKIAKYETPGMGAFFLVSTAAVFRFVKILAK